jgi:hypothetical protein
VAELTLNSSFLGNELDQLLTCAEIVPGDQPSYQICKTIYAYHPLGAKMVDAPITMAQAQQRQIAIPKGPEEVLKEAFLRQWEADKADYHISNLMRLSRIYGISSIALLIDGVPSDQPMPYKDLWKQDIGFNEFDPLNTAGSLVLNQTPNAIDFQKTTAIRVNNETYHRSRSCIMMNEAPLYIEWTTSSFGFVGRSVYQRALYPLKSFVWTMKTDELITRKAGVFIAKIKPAGSIVSNIQNLLTGFKRAILKEAKVDDVISIHPEEDITTLNMQNIDGAYTLARTNLLKNIATAADMPAKLLENETMVSGFGEGVEDAKNIARYIDRTRMGMQPAYAWMDKIIQYRAWNPDFYKTVQEQFPEEYGSMPYNQAFYTWVNSYEAEWPSLLIEPASEKIQVDDVKLKAVIMLMEVLLPTLDPQNQVNLVEWAADNFNQLKLMFGSPLELDMDTLAEFLAQQKQQMDQQQQLQQQGMAQQMQTSAEGGEQEGGGKDEAQPLPTASANDSQLRRKTSVVEYSDAVAKLLKTARKREGRKETADAT